MTNIHNWPPVSHSHDPRTSHEAETEVTTSGKRETDLQVVLRAVSKEPGLTSFELSQAIPDLTLYAVRRRLSDLGHQGSVDQGQAVARNGQRSSVTWWPHTEPVQLELGQETLR